MENSSERTKIGSVRNSTNICGEKAMTSSSHQLDLPIVQSSSLAEDLYKSRKELCEYKESIRDADFAKARAEMELTLLIKESNLISKFQKRDMEALKKPRIDSKYEENNKYIEVMRNLQTAKKDLNWLKLDVTSILRERIAAEKEIQTLRFKMEVNLRLLESLKKEIQVANEEHMLVELVTIEALREFNEIEMERDRKGKEALVLLLEKNKRIKEMSEEAARSKDIEKELLETTSDVKMLETQVNLVKKMESRVMSKSNRSFERGNFNLSVLKEATEAKKEELASVNAELFRLMKVMDMVRYELIKIKDERAWLERLVQKDDLKIQKLNLKMLMVKSRLETVSGTGERVRSLADNLTGSLEKLKKNKEAAKKEEFLLKEETRLTKAKVEKTKLEIDEKEREASSKLDEVEKVKHAEAIVLEKLETLIENTMERRELKSDQSLTITISRFEYEYLRRHGCYAEETAEKKVAAAMAWVEAVRASNKAILMKIESLVRESGMTKVEEEREGLRMERSVSSRRVVEGEIQKLRQNVEAKRYFPAEPVRKSVRKSKKLREEDRGKVRRYSTAGRGTPTYFVIKKKKKVHNLAKFFSRKR